jgi:amino acid permease
MQRVEKWRIQELALLLQQLHELLMKGNNNEWANVFLHFHQEAVEILSGEELSIEALRRLIHNIVNCFDGYHSFTNLSLGRDDSDSGSELNRDLNQTKVRLLSVLSEIDNRTTIYTH